ncbi:OmpA family protein [Lysobacter sp. S4-A87]|uniref:OmpA family protein n=1 Tax=Lysobacter sp. S4-A87 TaxID=2925843 RepID=UPI001F538DB3|nr:OmpA family protein [Lysobacter sp. S4-A87]UNK49520.1 OmpA family protein [Lysobacter sp. S4-A87]
MNTNKPHKPLMLVTALVTILAATSAFAADGDKSKIKGLITGVDGNTLTVKDGNNAVQTINVSADTKLKKTKGLTGVIHSKVEPGALIPGLPISADVVAAGSGFNATEISFKSEDFKTAQQVQAGVAPTSAVAAANAARMDDFGTYEALATTEVLFASGSTQISAKGKSDLDALAAKAKETKNYQVVLQGFTDSTGDAAANQRLSTMRGAAVSNYLQQQAGLMPGRVRAPDGMGVAADAGSGSNANARKVVVKLVVDKGQQEGAK